MIAVHAAVELECGDGFITLRQDGNEIRIGRESVDALAAALRAQSPRARERELTAARVRKHKALANGKGNGKKKESMPTVAHRMLAAEVGADCDVEWQKYQDWQANAKTKHRDKSAGFRNWLRNAAKFAPKQTQADKRAAVAAAIWGQYGTGTRGRQERDITAESRLIADGMD